VWKRALEEWGVKRKLSTAGHPQTNGQTERTNQWLIGYLRAYLDGQEGDWLSLLATAEFAHNSSRSKTTGKTPFEIVYGRVPRCDPEWVDVSKFEVAVEDRGETIREVRAAMKGSQAEQKKYADRRRRPADQVKPGDLVWLRSEALHRPRVPGKLEPRYEGPFMVTACPSETNVELRLPAGSRAHPKFHVSQVKKYYPGPKEEKRKWGGSVRNTPLHQGARRRVGPG
jgi:hypothetical protein